MFDGSYRAASPQGAVLSPRGFFCLLSRNWRKLRYTQPGPAASVSSLILQFDHSWGYFLHNSNFLLNYVIILLHALYITI